MKKYYFTYGTSEQYPFRGGWTLVYAPDINAATMVFRAYHPDVTEGILNCADYYPAEHFEKSEAYTNGNLGGGLHEIIGAFKMKKGE